MELFVVIATLCLLVGLTLLWMVMREKKRDAALALAAEDLSFEYRRDGRTLLGEKFTRFALFQDGRRRRIKNVLQGHYDHIEALLFDYRYITGSHLHFRVHRQTVGAFKLVDEELPEFSLRPENVIHKISEAMGYQDIDFDENQAFSSRYLLRGPDEDAIRDLFTPEMLKFFADNPGLSVEGGGQWIVVFRRDRRVDTSKLGDFVKSAFEICTLFGIR